MQNHNVLEEKVSYVFSENYGMVYNWNKEMMNKKASGFHPKRGQGEGGTHYLQPFHMVIIKKAMNVTRY